jgi:hypothetical protein
LSYFFCETRSKRNVEVYRAKNLDPPPHSPSPTDRLVTGRVFSYQYRYQSKCSDRTGPADRAVRLQLCSIVSHHSSNTTLRFKIRRILELSAVWIYTFLILVLSILPSENIFYENIKIVEQGSG